MGSNQDQGRLGYQYDSQPGLEVVSDTSAPEVVPQEYYKGNYSPQVSLQQENPYAPTDKVLAVAPYQDSPEKVLANESSLEVPLAPGQKPQSRRRLYIVIGAAVALLVIIAAVVGGVLGSRVSRDSSGSSSSGSGVSESGSTTGTSTATSAAFTPTASAALSQIRENSRLAVTGWRGVGDFDIRLFYQDGDDNLRISTYASTSENWTASTKIAVSGALNGTGMGAAGIMQNTPPQAQYYWLNDSLLLSGQNFRDGVTPFAGVYDSVDEWPMGAAARSSRLAMYWPYTVLQKTVGELWLVTYTASATDTFVNQSLGVQASEGSGLALVPRTAKYESPLTAALLYRTTEGRLGGYWVEYNSTGEVWDMGGESITIPESSAIAAFAIGKTTTMNYLYVLYQDDQDVIQFAAYDSSDGWSAPATSDALSGADKGTDITCLTEAVWPDINELSSERDMSRCYYQSFGRLKEVIYDGSEWSVVGYVPLS